MFPTRIPIVLVLTGILLTCMADAMAAENVTLGLPAIAPSSTNPAQEQITALGKKLFFDARLSRDGTISCTTCHKPELAFTDGRSLAKGTAGRVGTRNAPTLLNVAFNTSQFWDGRRQTLEAQALDPLVNPREQGLPDDEALLKIIRHDQDYVELFRIAFSVEPTAIRPEHVGRALAAFERTLLAGDSPFDRFQFGGDLKALSAGAQRGLLLFQGRAGCASCHIVGKESALFTDNDFHSVNVGLQRIAPRLAELTTRLVKARQAGTSLDQTVLSEEDLAELGRFAVTLNPADIGKFRTPSLRNVALTGPYMHDGSVASLRDAVEMELYNRGADMGRPLILTPQEKSDIVAFLESLTSPIAKDFGAR